MILIILRLTAQLSSTCVVAVGRGTDQSDALDQPGWPKRGRWDADISQRYSYRDVLLHSAFDLRRRRVQPIARGPPTLVLYDVLCVSDFVLIMAAEESERGNDFSMIIYDPFTGR